MLTSLLADRVGFFLRNHICVLLASNGSLDWQGFQHNPANEEFTMFWPLTIRCCILQNHGMRLEMLRSATIIQNH